VPKGLPEEIGVQHLAIRVEDHALEFGSFDGEIPEGQYGAGTILVWDRGVYDLLAWSEERIEVILHGQRFSGRYALIRFRRKGEREWLLSRSTT
jgi:bifunctional non-homologous end joining protein LigD